MDFARAFSELDRGHVFRGAWFSDRWLKELGDGLLAIDLPDEIAQLYELSSDLHGYPRWVVPCAASSQVTGQWDAVRLQG